MLNMDTILTEDNLEQSLVKLCSKKNGCGTDGIQLRDFPEYWSLNKSRIITMLKAGKYIPSDILEREIIMANGKHRKISLYTCTDRLILRAIFIILQGELNTHLSPYSYAYRQSAGIIPAVRQAASYIQSGKQWLVEIDIENFFDNINLQKMSEILRVLITDDLLFTLLNRYLHCRIQDNESLCLKTKGIVQGCSLSPLFSNLYMDKLDKNLELQELSFCRFSDNINIYVTSQTEAFRVFDSISNTLKKDFDLSINQAKSGVYPALNRSFLGYTFTLDKKTHLISFQKKSKNITSSYQTWHPNAIQQIDRNYHIINNGILTKKDYTLLFENQESKRYLPVETVGSLNIYSDVIFTSGFFDFANQQNLRVSIYDKYGKFLGAFYPKKHALSAKLILRQVSLYQDTAQRLIIAKSIITAAAHNIRANLKYYKKQGRCSSQEIATLSAYLSELNRASSIEQLLLTEARCRQFYYTCMGRIIDDDNFPFSKRTKRPPQDEVNAMISFGNVFLYERIATEITKTTLDVRIGFLHSTNNRSASLNLDIAEIFKPLIVDRVIFTLIHKKIINKSCFESYQQNGIYLNAEGKRIFIKTLQEKLYSHLQVKGNTVTYDRLIRDEIQKIYRKVTRDEPYKPYKYY